MCPVAPVSNTGAAADTLVTPERYPTHRHRKPDGAPPIPSLCPPLSDQEEERARRFERCQARGVTASAARADTDAMK